MDKSRTIFIADGGSWCAVTNNYDHDGLWGYCAAVACSGTTTMEKQPFSHAEGAYPYHIFTDLDGCLEACLGDEACRAVDWEYVYFLSQLITNNIIQWKFEK